MDLLEKLNRRFGSWYENLFGGTETIESELRPKDILRRILAAMEDGRREGLDGQVYVPNAYTLRIAVASDAERDYLKAFLSAEELANAVARTISQHGYRTRGGLLFVIEEADATNPDVPRVAVDCRFDTTVANTRKDLAPAPAGAGGGTPEPVVVEEKRASPVAPPLPMKDTAPVREGRPIDEPEELGTVPAAFGAAGATIATLLVRAGDGRSLEAFPLTPKGVTIGRSRQTGNDIVLSDVQVSKRHARIAFERGIFVFYDENSTNGSRVNEVPVQPGVGQPLAFGDTVRIGETTLTLKAAGGNTTPAPPPVVTPGAVPGKAALVEASGTVYRLASEMTVGRSVTADITLSGDGVSDKHARIRSTEAGRLTVEDLNTPGGTFVNDERIPPLFPVSLFGGDRIAFGSNAPLTVRIG